MRSKHPRRSMLLRHADVFDDKPGQCNILKHEIKLKPGSKPVTQRAYRIPPKLKYEVEKQIKQLLEQGKIRPSKSEYSSPVVCIMKPSGDMRRCIDYRKLNQNTVFDRYPTPNTEEILLKIEQFRYITSLDGVSGYWQVSLDEDAVE